MREYAPRPNDAAGFRTLPANDRGYIAEPKTAASRGGGPMRPRYRDAALTAATAHSDNQLRFGERSGLEPTGQDCCADTLVRMLTKAV